MYVDHHGIACAVTAAAAKTITKGAPDILKMVVCRQNDSMTIDNDNDNDNVSSPNGGQNLANDNANKRDQATIKTEATATHGP